jgi:hypothetical protein
MWDAKEPVAEYAQKARLASTLTLSLGDGVVRGGAYSANAAVAGNCRSAIRRPTEVLTITGFRIMVPLTEETR